MIAGGVESMTRAPFVLGKARQAFARETELYDTTIGWRFVNPLLKAQYGIDAMPETAENVAEDFQIRRADQDAFALRSQQRAAAAQAAGRLAAEIVPVEVKERRGEVRTVDAGRASAPRDHARAPGRAADAVPRGRLGHRGQRVGRQRRRGGGAGRLRGGGRGAGPRAARAHRRDGAAPAWRRGSWGSARCRRPAGCSSAPACGSPTWP